MDETIKGRRDVKWSFPWIRPVVHADGHPGSFEVVGCTPSFYWKSNTTAFCLGGVVGGWRGGFFFSSCIWCGEWTVHVHLDNGQWTFHASFIWARGGGFIFLSANGKAQGALLLFLLSLGGGKDFFSIFPCFPMCSHGVPSKFLMVSHYVPQVHNVFLNMLCI